MNIEEIREYCLAKKGVTEETPFGPDTLVYKVMGKMFALTGLDQDLRINLKCDPEVAVDLRERYPAVQPGYHMSKKHWNSVYADGSLPDNLIYAWVDDSYDLVVSSLKRAEKEALSQL